MVLNKQQFAEKFGRWVDENEIVIEDLPEPVILNIAGRMSKKGYCLEYWKAPKQESGHLHIKDIIFPKEPILSPIQKRKYKLEVIKRYVPEDFWNQVDWNFVKQKRHRIAEENKEHFKGYGVKALIKSWNDGSTNRCEKDLFEGSMRIKNASRDVVTPVEMESHDLLTFRDFEKLKKDKNYIVEDFLMPETVTMIYSPPANFKSILAESLGFCISNGKKFLGLKTKKQPVLYLDGENSNQILKERYFGLYKGMNLKRKGFPFYVLKGGMLLDSKKKIHIGFLAYLEQVIEQKGVRVLVFDTLHRFAFYDENRADDINILYTQVFRPLIERYGVSIVFLHHSTKAGNYRGSGDFLGMVDVSYSIVREGKTNKFRIINEKCRSGEITDIRGEIDFGEDYIKLIQHDSKKEKEKSVNKLKEVTEKIKGLFKTGSELRRKEIIDFFVINDYDFGSTKTIDRALKFLYENSFLSKDSKGVYTLVLR